MNKKIVLFVGIFLLISLIAFAFSTDRGKYVAFDTGDLAYNGSHPSDDDALTSYGWTASGAAAGSSIIYDNSGQFLGNMSMANSAGGEQGVDIEWTSSSNITMMVSIYDPGGSGSNIMKIMSRSDFAHQLGILEDQSDTNYYGYDSGSFYDTSVGRTVGWHNLSFEHSGGRVIHRVDNTVVRNSSTNTATTMLTLYNNGFTDGYYDNVLVWNGTFDDIPQVTNFIDLTLDSPPDNAVNNTANQVFFYTPTALVNSLDTAQLWTNTSGWAANLTNTSPTDATSNNFVLALPEGPVLWNIRVNDTEGNVKWGTNRTLNVDRSSPQISVDNSAIWNNIFAGYSAPLLSTESNVSGQVNVTDDNLHSFNISILGERVIYNVTNISGTTLSYDLNHDISDLGAGRYTLQVYAADGHTAKRIDDYEYSYGMNSVKFNFPQRGLFDDEYVEINFAGISGDLTVEKELDRYTFNYQTLTPRNALVAFVESSGYIQIVNEDQYGYPGHLIIEGIDDNKGKWVDFKLAEGYATGNEIYNVTRENDHKVKIEITNLNGKEWQFESIGDLNVITQQYQFDVINATATYYSPVLQTSSNEFILNFTLNTSKYDLVTGLQYNSTAYTTTKANGSTWQSFTKTITAPTITSTPDQIPFYWNFTLSGAANQSNQTESLNQTVESILLDDCSVATYQTLNYTVWDETAHTLLTSNVSAIINYQYLNINENFSTSFTNVNNFAFCLNPSYANLTGDILLQYSAGSAQRDWITQNSTLDNNTEYFNLYLNTGATTAIDILVQDTTETDLPGVLVVAQRLNISNNVWFTVETELTDINGNAQFNLETPDVYHRFLLFQGSDLKLQTGQFKLTETSYTFVIGETVTTPAQVWLTLNSIDTSLTFTNATSTFTYTWDDTGPIGSAYCLNITQAGSFIDGQCSSANSGSLAYAATPNGTYLAQGYVRLGGTYYVVETLGVDLGGAWRVIGQGAGIAMAFLIYLIIVFMGFKSPQIAVVAAILASIVIYALRLIPMSKLAITSIVLVGIVIITVMRRSQR